MIKKCIFVFLLLFSFTFSNASASDYSQRLTYCMIGNTSDENKVILINWLISAMVSHPRIRGVHSVTFDQELHDALDRKMANFMIFILNSCQNEFADVIDYEGELAVEKAFSTWGEMAFMLLLQNAKVQENLSSFERYFDLSKLKIDI